MDIQTLIEGGTISIVFLVLWFAHQERREYRKIIANHINHNTKALTELLTWLKKNGK